MTNPKHGEKPFGTYGSMAMTIKDKIQEWQKLYERASPGPWTLKWDNTTMLLCEYGSYRIANFCESNMGATPRNTADFFIIAAAPEMFQTIKELHALALKQNEALESCNNDWDVMYDERLVSEAIDLAKQMGIE